MKAFLFQYEKNNLRSSIADILLKHVWILFVSVFILILTACEAPIQNEKSQNSAEEYASNKTTIISRNIRIENAWTPPELLGTELDENFSSSRFNGPSFALDFFSNGIVIWKQEGLMLNSQSYQSRTSVIKRESSAAGWTDESTTLNFDANVTSFPIIKSDRNSGTRYLLWTSDSKVFLRVYTTAGGWRNSKIIGNTRFSADIFLTDLGNAIVYWPLTTTNGGWAISARYYSFKNDLLSAEVQLPRPSDSTSIAISTSKMTAAQLPGNQSLFSWQEIKTDVLSNRLLTSKLMSAVFHPDNGWSAVQTITPLTLDTRIDNLVLAAHILQNKAVLVALSPASNLVNNLGISVIYNNGIWSPSTALIRTDVDTDAGFRKNIVFDSNKVGDITLAWSELTVDTSGQNSVAQSNQISVKQFLSSSGWSDINVVSDSIPFIPPSTGVEKLHLDYPAVTLNNNGNIAVAWVDNTQPSPEIFINHFSPDSLWKVQQLVATSSGSVSDSLSVHLDGNNTSTVIWSDKMQTLLGLENRVWISHYSQTGNVVTPPNGQNPAPTAGIPPNHNLFTTDCGFCHNGTDAIGKHISHIISSNRCSACHSSIAWLPMIVVDHSEVLGPCEDCHDGLIASGKSIIHLATSNQCATCHSTVSWLPIIIFNHAEANGTCDSCHNNIIAIGKSLRHIPSSEACESCHIVGGWTLPVIGPPLNPQPTPPSGPPVFGLPQNHNNFAENCSTCHDGVNASSKNITHILSSDRCGACHTPLFWHPVLFVNHIDAIGSCESCHNNLIARGKSTFHIPTVNSCADCHSTLNWSTSNFTFDHNQVIGSCISCHNSTTAEGKNSFHILSSDRCSACHSTAAWIPLIIDMPPQAPPGAVIPVGHNLFADSCSSCHDKNTASGKPPQHMPTTTICGSCHANTQWFPLFRVDHNQVLARCESCHNGIIAANKSPFHLTTTETCGSCHSIDSWLINPLNPANPAVVDHNEVIGSCVSCHNGTNALGKHALHITSSDQCQTCHTAATWIPVAMVDHNEVIGDCEKCHLIPLNHQSVVESCGFCHTTLTWLLLVQ